VGHQRRVPDEAVCKPPSGRDVGPLSIASWRRGVLTGAALVVLATVVGRDAEAQPAVRPSALLADRKLDLAFMRGSYPRASEIWLRESGGTRERLLTRVRGRIYDFRWMSSGAEMLLWVDRAPVYRLLRRDGSIEPVDEAEIQCASSPLPGREGTKLGCFETEIEIIRDGQLRQLVKEQENVFIGDVELSPNGKLVAYVDSASVDPAPYLLSVITTEGRSRFSTRSPTEFMDKDEISWSADSRRIAYGIVRPVGGTSVIDLLPRWLRKHREAVMVLDARGHPTARFAPGARPDWSANGRRIAFDRSTGGRRHLFVAGANGTRATQIASGPRDSWRPRWRR
jgi:hypothetical protein